VRTEAQELAFCGWMEDAGEGVGFCYNVMHVVTNRVKSPDFPNTIHDVIYQKNAFSWTRSDDPQYGKKPQDGDQTYEACLYAAPSVIAGDSDPTSGACYYANLSVTPKDSWFWRNIVDKPDLHPVIGKFGKHTFFK
jgi:N-acetylmuramoyl-L-alanine amidase